MNNKFLGEFIINNMNFNEKVQELQHLLAYNAKADDINNYLFEHTSDLYGMVLLCLEHTDVVSNNTVFQLESWSGAFIPICNDPEFKQFISTQYSRRYSIQLANDLKNHAFPDLSFFDKLFKLCDNFGYAFVSDYTRAAGSIFINFGDARPVSKDYLLKLLEFIESIKNEKDYFRLVIDLIGYKFFVPEELFSLIPSENSKILRLFDRDTLSRFHYLNHFEDEKKYDHTKQHHTDFTEKVARVIDRIITRKSMMEAEKFAKLYKDSPSISSVFFCVVPDLVATFPKFNTIKKIFLEECENAPEFDSALGEWVGTLLQEYMIDALENENDGDIRPVVSTEARSIIRQGIVKSKYPLLKNVLQRKLDA